MYIPGNSELDCKMRLWYQRSPLAAAGGTRQPCHGSQDSLGIWKAFFWANLFFPNQTNLWDLFGYSHSLDPPEQPLLVIWVKILDVLEVPLYWALKWTWKSSRSSCITWLKNLYSTFKVVEPSGDWAHSWGTVNSWRLKSYKPQNFMSYIGCYQN